MAGAARVQYVVFGLNGDDENKKASHAEVTSYELFTAEGPPVVGGVYDARLGSMDHNTLCPTCAQGKKQCHGHRGHHTMRMGMLQPVGISEIRRWLKVICLGCGALMVEPERFEGLAPARRLAEAAGVQTEGKRCTKCSAVHPKIVKDDKDHFTFWAESTRGVRVQLYPDTIAACFERVSDNTVALLGRSLDVHPRKLVLRIVSVPPNTIRPLAKSYGGGGTSYHESTNLLQHLVKRSGQLPDQLPEHMGPRGPGAPTEVDQESPLTRAVQNTQQIYFDLIMGSSGTSATQGTNGRRGLVVGSRPVHSFLRNLPGKKGRLRENLLGKRVFFISRTTISGNMSYRISEVGIPLAFARTLQVQETVQEFNREYLMTFFLNGRRQYPGCTHIIRKATGEVHDVAGLRAASLEIGDVIFRDVVNGDQAYFGRQPSLERSSIAVHDVVVIQNPAIHTFQFNVLACEFYNADFDGDQMYLFVARCPAARAEAAIMSRVSNWFISTKSGGPVNGQVQDSIVGCHALTKEGVLMDKYHAMTLFSNAGGEPPRFDLQPPSHIWTGREVVSLLLKQTPVNYRRVPSSYSDVYAPYINFPRSDTLTVVERGELIRGVLDKRAIGAGSTGGIFHLISREFGPQRALDTIFSLQQLSLQFLLYKGFSIGTADLLPNEDALLPIRDMVDGVRMEAKVVTDRLLRGEIVPPIDSTVHEFYENLQIEALKLPDAEALRWVLGSIRPETNGLYTMIAVDSKGKVPNMIHISCCIAQSLINGARLHENFAFRRTLPYFPRFSTDPFAYGFVANSYMTGMTAVEFICQAMVGRLTLICKALATAGAGYFMRKGVMITQSCIIDNYRRITKDTRIVSMLYGDDSLDSRELERVEFSTINMSDEELRRATWADTASAEEAAAVKEAVDMIKADRDAYRASFSRIELSNFVQPFSAEVLMPVNVKRIVDGVFIARDAASGPASGLASGLLGRIKRVKELAENIPYILLNAECEKRKRPIPPHLRAASMLLSSLVRAELCPRVLANISDDELSFIEDAIRLRYSISLIDYGTVIGILAAQAISEPITQMLLDNIHSNIGKGSSSGSLLNRVDEIYGGRPEQSSAMRLPLVAGLGTAAAQEVANAIESVDLSRFTKLHDVLLDPYPRGDEPALVYPPYASDIEWISEFSRTHPLLRPPGDLTNWCFRFVLEKSALVLKAVDLELVVRRLRAKHPSIYVTHTSESVESIIIRVWLRAPVFRRGGDDEATARAALSDILDTPIRGIRGITRTSVETVVRASFAEDGSPIKENTLCISTTGTNLYRAMLHPAVKTSEAISTGVADTYRMFGIEAAYSKIISETRTFMGDKAPNLRHIAVYAAEMTRTGKVTNVERSGHSVREHNNVLLRMSYGSPIQVITDATFENARSKVYGIAAPRLLGDTPFIGTLYNSLVVDEKFVRENLHSVDQVLDDL